jgi:hypothetical protein
LPSEHSALNLFVSFPNEIAVDHLITDEVREEVCEKIETRHEADKKYALSICVLSLVGVKGRELDEEGKCHENE